MVPAVTHTIDYQAIEEARRAAAQPQPALQPDRYYLGLDLGKCRTSPR